MAPALLFESTISICPKNNHRRAMAPALLLASTIPIQSSKEQRSTRMFCLFSENTLERLKSAVSWISKYSISNSERAFSFVYSKLATDCWCLLRSRYVLYIQKTFQTLHSAISSFRLSNIHPASQIPEDKAHVLSCFQNFHVGGLMSAFSRLSSKRSNLDSE